MNLWDFYIKFLGEQQPTPAAFRDEYLMPSTNDLTEERMDEYAVTPPALLNTGEEPVMEEQSATTAAHNGEDDESHEQMDVEEAGRGFEVIFEFLYILFSI